MFRGSLVALVTPMTESGDVDQVAFARLLDWHASEGSDGVVVGGTTGESATLTSAESAELLQTAVQRLGGRLPVIAGTGGASTAQSVERTRTACDVDAPPVPAITGMRPPRRCTAICSSSAASAADSVADSPVVPPTTTPSLPSRACQSSSRANATMSTSPDSVIGVTSATRLPRNMSPPGRTAGIGGGIVSSPRRSRYTPQKPAFPA